PYHLLHQHGQHKAIAAAGADSLWFTRYLYGLHVVGHHLAGCKLLLDVAPLRLSFLGAAELAAHSSDQSLCYPQLYWWSTVRLAGPAPSPADYPAAWRSPSRLFLDGLDDG